MSVQRQIEQLMALQASEWFEKVHANGAEEYPAFIRWLCQSPQHMMAYLEVVAVVLEARRIDLKSHYPHGDALVRAAPQVIELSNARVPTAVTHAPPARLRRWRHALATAASIFMLAALPIRDTIPTWRDYATAAGELRVIELPDRSVVRINAQSLVQVKYGEMTREIWLRHGEALFAVARDSRRPFRVHTPDAVVQAVGTQFNVMTRAGGTTVAVLEGKVRVSMESEPESRSMRPASHALREPVAIDAGEAAHIDSVRGIEPDRDPQLATVTAWARKQIAFKRAALEDIVGEVNRHNPMLQFQLEGIQPGSHHYTGVFDAYDPDSLAAFLSKEDGMEIERHDRRIVIRERDRAGSDNSP